MNFELTKSRKLAKLLGVITALHEEGNFIFEKDKVILMQTDLAKVSMVKLTIDKTFFDKYENEESTRRRYDVNTIAQWIGEDEGRLTAKEVEGETGVFLRLTQKQAEGSRSIVTPSSEAFEELPYLPEDVLIPDTIFECRLATLKKVLKDCIAVSEDFVLESSEDGLTIAGESPHLGKVKNDFVWGETFVAEKVGESIEPRAQGYRTLLFLDFIKSLEENGVDKVKIMYGWDKPLQLIANLENVKIEYALASLVMPEQGEI